MEGGVYWERRERERASETDVGDWSNSERGLSSHLYFLGYCTWVLTFTNDGKLPIFSLYHLIILFPWTKSNPNVHFCSFPKSLAFVGELGKSHIFDHPKCILQHYLVRWFYMVTLLEIIDLVCMMAFNAEENNHFNFEGYIFFLSHPSIE